MACQDRCNVQIVAMSATMAGLDSLSLWLDAHLFLTNFRPVPLTEHAVFEGTVYVKQAQVGARGEPNDKSVHYCDEQATLRVFETCILHTSDQVIWHRFMCCLTPGPDATLCRYRGR